MNKGRLLCPYCGAEIRRLPHSAYVSGHYRCWNCGEAGRQHAERRPCGEEALLRHRAKVRATGAVKRADPPPDPDDLIPELPWWVKLLVSTGFIKDPRFSTESEEIEWRVRRRIKEIEREFKKTWNRTE